MSDEAQELADFVKQGTDLTKKLVSSAKKADEWKEGIDHYDKTIDLAETAGYADRKKLYANRSLCHVKMAYTLKKDKDQAKEHAEEAKKDGQKCIDLDATFARGYERKVKALQELAALNQDDAGLLDEWEETTNKWHTAAETAHLQAGDNNTKKQLTGAVEMVAKISQERIHRRLRGKWSGTVTPELGGYGQQYNFVDNDTIEVTILTNTITAKYQINTSKEPYTMDIIIIPPGQTQPQVAPYIFRFESGNDDCMEMCCPCGVIERPTEFKGGGMVTMERKALAEEDDEEKERISKMPEPEKISAYIQEFITELGDKQIVDPNDQQNPQNAIEISRVEIRLVMLKLKYGTEVGEKVDNMINVLVNGLPRDDNMERHKDEVERLRKQLVLTGFIQDEGSPKEPELSEVDKLKQQHKTTQAEKKFLNRPKLTKEQVEAEFKEANGGEPITIPKLKEYIKKHWSYGASTAETEKNLEDDLQRAVNVIMAQVDKDGSHTMDEDEFTFWLTGNKTETFEAEERTAVEAVEALKEKRKKEKRENNIEQVSEVDGEESQSLSKWLVLGALVAVASVTAFWVIRKNK